jgi:hypothetical protein
MTTSHLLASGWDKDAFYESGNVHIHETNWPLRDQILSLGLSAVILKLTELDILEHVCSLSMGYARISLHLNI